MALTINITYTGAPGAARAFADEMVAAGVVDGIRAEEGNLRYEYFQPLDDPDSI
ncbi:MAG: antibiotic biosynthesis monooxygenase, partial [Atopobiaceae bacterium]|nr:antibiotic biosynthesis monooxygenase [Atopobiaceae bacterium]